MATVTVANVQRDAADGAHVSPVSASAAPPPTPWSVVIISMAAVAAASAVMWFTYGDWVKPAAIKIMTGYVPFAGLVVVTAALERLLEPLGQLLLPRDSSPASTLQAAASSRTQAQAAAADPDMPVTDVELRTQQAALDQAAADARRTERTIIFWAIASVCGLGISGGFGFFLLQPVAASHVNSFLDLMVTGLAIGAGTKPVHDLITSIQSKAARSAG
jgi:hypothetical protein